MTKTTSMIAAALDEVCQDFFLLDDDQWLARTVLLAATRRIADRFAGTVKGFDRDAFIKEALGDLAPPSIEDMEAEARKIHQEHYDARGDRYATPEELKMHLDDPLANIELVRDELTMRMRHEVVSRCRIIPSSQSELRHAAEGVAATAEYNARCKASA